MRFQIVDRLTSVLVFENDTDVNYCASCQVQLYGDKGIMFGINGHKFYELMAAQGEEVMKQLGIVTLEGYITSAHARLMRIALRKVATVTIAHKGQMAGHEMVWIVIRAKEK